MIKFRALHFGMISLVKLLNFGSTPLEAKSSKKFRIFLRLTLMNQVLTWNKMQVRKKHGPGICLLCRNDGEINVHLSIQCADTQGMWKEVENITGIENEWNGKFGNRVEDCLRAWFEKKELRAIPCLGGEGILAFFMINLIYLSSYNCTFQLWHRGVYLRTQLIHKDRFLRF